ncbi:MAG: UDP-N-acetylmuramoyl-L-alanine--D-glutamate ligase [Armatimonadetes bacterium]|nr:UDP-N-acetylmuramoyl-L-alanine--D-glutamate ligase [Armatimonadota bacterium]
MMTVGGWQVERAVVCGGGYSGQALARTLCRLGAQVTVTDSRAADDPTVQASLRVFADLGVALVAGGHDAETIAAADLVVVSPGVSIKEPALRAARERGVPVWGEIELASRLCTGRLIGITGTKGKSTTAALTAKMLDAPLTNSEAYTARGIPLIELVVDNPNADPIVVEVTSYQLEGIDQMRPWVSTLLNIAEDHTDRHPTRDEYAWAKSRIFENQTDDDCAVYNLDDPAVRAIGERQPAVRLGVSEREVPEYGVWSESDGVHARLPESLGGYAGTLISWDDVSPALLVQKPSLLAATATALGARARVADVVEVLRSFPGLPHRMERVTEIRGVTYVNDSKATNPLATGNAIAQSPAPVVLIAGGLTKGIDLSPLVEPFRRLRALVLIGQDAPLLAAVAEQAGLANTHRADSLESAVSLAQSLAEPGDWVILSPCGASFDMFDNFSHRGERFREIVLSLAK